jgi:Domain of unknown function (DUF6089)
MNMLMRNKYQMLRKPLILAAMLVVVNITNAQVEWIGSVGTSHFLGDLGGKPSLGTQDITDLNLQSTRYMVGTGLRVNLGKSFAIRGSGYYARVSANDAYTSNTERHMRNLNFFSPILGGEAVVELKFGNGSDRFSAKNWFIYAGAGYFTFNPKTKYQGSTVELQPLGTEGQFFMAGKSPYAKQSFTIPFGIGYKIKATKFGYLSAQVESRKTFTDYIDDVSTQFPDKTLLLASNGQMAVDLSDRSIVDGRIPGFSDPGTIRGNPNNMDNFFFLTVSYNVILSGHRPGDASFGSPRFRYKRAKGSKHGCYSF